MNRKMEKKRLLGSSDESEDDLDVYPQRFLAPTKKKSYKIEFKDLKRIVKDGNLDEVTNALKKRNLQLKDEAGLSLLHVAAAANREDVLRLLLEDKRCLALLDYQDQEGVTPLLAAVMVGSHETLRLLCSAGADPCKTLARNGRNALHVAARRCDSKAVEIVLQYNSSPELINALNDNGDTPLVESVYVKADVIDQLSAAGADITIQNPESGRTVLHVVMAYNRKNLLRKVLQHPQATVEFADIQDVKHDTALLIAVKLDRLDLITILLEFFAELIGINDIEHESVFHIAVRHDRPDILKVLAQSGCRKCIDYVDASFRTPLLYAAELDRSQCLRELVENEADYNLRNRETGESFVHVIARTLSYTALHYIMNITDISWFFTQPDKNGNTPYMSAISAGNALFLQEALKMKPVDLCDENAEGEPPIYYTTRHGHLRIMMALLMSPRYYAYINCRSSFLEDAEFTNYREIMMAEMRGDLYATDVYLLTGKVVKRPLVRWFPKALLLTTREDRNIFHACAVGGNLEGLRFLYEFFLTFEPKFLSVMFDHKDLMGNSPILFAAQCGVSSIACIHFFATHGADLATVNYDGLNFFNAIFTYNPEVAESLLMSLFDSCVTGKREHYYQDKMHITLDFTMLCPQDETMNQMAVVYALFNEMDEHETPKAKRKVLQHPVLESFLKTKFNNERKYLLYRFVILLCLTILLSFFMPILYIGDSPEHKYSFITPVVQDVLIALFFLASAVPAFIKLPNLICGIVWPSDAVCFVPFIVMVILVSLGRTFALAPELTATMLLCYWIYVMVFLTTMYSTFSFQMAVLFQILNSISKHLLVLGITLFAFSLSFFCVYHTDPKFSNLPMSFIYTAVVLLLGYSHDLPTFDIDYYTNTPMTLHFLIECFLLIAFTLIVLLGFLNMLVGLAVRSADVAEHDGKVYQQHHQAHVLYMTEYWFNNRLFSWMLEKGICVNILKRLREGRRVKMILSLYDPSTKKIVDEANNRKFQSIMFYQRQSKTSEENLSDGRSAESFGDALYGWIRHRSAGMPTSKSFFIRQAHLDAERSHISLASVNLKQM